MATEGLRAACGNRFGAEIKNFDPGTSGTGRQREAVPRQRLGTPRGDLTATVDASSRPRLARSISGIGTFDQHDAPGTPVPSSAAAGYDAIRAVRVVGVRECGEVVATAWALALDHPRHWVPGLGIDRSSLRLRYCCQRLASFFWSVPRNR